MSGSYRPDDMDYMPTAPSPPSASPPILLSQNMSEDDSYEDHDPREWMIEDRSIYDPSFERHRGPYYIDEMDESDDAFESVEFDMTDAEIGQGVPVTMWQARTQDLHILHSSQKVTLRKKKRVVHGVEILESIPERQGVGPGGVLRGSVDEKLKAKGGKSVVDHLKAFDEAMDEAIEDHRELEGDAIREQPRGEHVRDGPCPLCHGGLCTLRHALDAFSDIHKAGSGIASNGPDWQPKGKGKARIVEEQEPGSQSKGKGKAKLMEEDLEQDGDLELLLAQAEKLHYVQPIDRLTPKISKASKPSGKGKSTQSITKKTSYSKRPGKK